ncbi:hypothetical protein [Micromonospora sp. NPDC050695]|uniref:hypothetical protein n=1 Tax=Micromonospora sp. NPDC050695 TaxID=3154938 RepID=UPI0033ED1787
MQVSQALDVMEALLQASDHPDIAAIARYGRDSEVGGQSPPGVSVLHRSSDTRALLTAFPAPRDATPVPLPTEPITMRWRAARILVLAHQLLDAARPEVFASWDLCRQEGTHGPIAAALRITARDGSVIYLRGLAASGQVREPETDPYPDYQIPLEGVRSWHLSPSAPSAALV